MYWLIGLLIVLVLVLIVVIALMYVTQECKENVIITHRNEHQKLMAKYEHLLVQLGDAGFEVRVSYSDSCHIKLVGNDKQE